MITPRAIPFLKPGLALGAGRHAGFAHAWNWLIHSFWHMTLGCGLKWIDKWRGYPKIELRIRAGDGIDVDYGEDGWITISQGDGETDYGEESGGGGDDRGEEDTGSVDDDPPEDGTMDGPDGSRDVRPPDQGGGGLGESCNNFSADLPNDDEDPGLDNPGDDCAILNGW